MRITEIAWRELEAAPSAAGVASLRLYPHSGHDLFLAVQQPDGRRMLILRVPRAVAEAAARRHGSMPAARGLTLRLAPTADGLHELQIVLTATDRREVFNPLITDIAQTAQACDTPEKSLEAAIRRFGHWQHLLQSIADNGLGAEARRGLYGELTILRNHLLTLSQSLEAVNAWTGPTGAHQDFQLPATAIEVKTGTAKAPETLLIASERQLDTVGVDNLLLAHVAVDERRGGTGESLNTVTDAIRASLGGAALLTFNDLLTTAGYLTEHRRLYDEPRYTVRHTHFWRVADEFPRLTAADLRPGVGDCRYRIATVGLDRWRITADEVARHVKDQP